LSRHEHPTAPNAQNPIAGSRKGLGLWFLAIAAMVLVMVLLGGITRLTDSGLSIMEWKPLLGTLPPLNEAAWSRVFALYQANAEYKHVNPDMTLAGFKAIFWWEYVHRLWGRLIGLAVLVPGLYFLFRGRLTRGWSLRIAFVFLLGLLQGFAGWFMVASGFEDRVDVNQYRLVLHLSLALLIYAVLLWYAFDLLSTRQPPAQVAPQKATRVALRIGILTLGLLTFAIMIGGFVAGLHGGLVYNTFPLMGESLVPPELFQQSPWWRNVFEVPAAAQFLHRCMAAAVTLAAFGFTFAAHRAAVLWRDRGDTVAAHEIARRANIVLLMLGIQLCLGISTLLFVVPLPLAVTHQAGALVLFSALLFALHGLYGRLYPARGGN